MDFWEDIVKTVNRLGIILNFMAGFMVAPDLIGIKRLKIFEKILEKQIQKFTDWNSNTRWLFFNLAKEVYEKLPFIGYSILMLTTFYYGFEYVEWLIKNPTSLQAIVSFALLIILLIIFLIFLSLITFYVRGRDFGNVSQDTSFASSLFQFITFILWIIPLWLMSLTRILLRLLISLILAVPVFCIVIINAPFKFTLSYLESGEEQLLKVYTTIGLVFLITGNFFQFIATYDDF